MFLPKKITTKNKNIALIINAVCEASFVNGSIIL